MKIAATAPEYPWSDLAQSLQPNGSDLDYVANAPYSGMLNNHEFGIQKNNWNATLFGAGQLLGYYAPTSIADPESNLVEWNTFNSTGGPYNGKPLAVQQEEQLPNHSPYYTNLSEPPSPSIMENGWNDDLFPVDNTVDYYNKVRAAYPNQAMQLFDLDLGHNPRSATTPSTSDVGKLATAQNNWFEYYVKGQGSEPAQAHGGVTAITSDCPATAANSGTEYKAANWASLAPGEIRLEGGAEQTILAPGTAPDSSFIRQHLLDAGRRQQRFSGDLQTRPGTRRRLHGRRSSTVIAEVSTPAANDQIIARLYDVNEPEGGTQQLIGRAIYRPISPGGGFVKQVFQLHPQAWKVASGHVLKLELLVQDSSYARTSSSPSSMQVRNLEMRVPTIQPPGSDGGLVQTPLPGYLPPGYTFARNDATTVPGVPYLSSGTNPNTGSFTLAWEASAPAAGLIYTLQHKPASGGWSTVATGLTSPEYTFTPGSPEAEGTWTYRVSASNEGPEGEFSGASVEIKVDRSAPAVVSEPASSVSQTSATLNATVNPKDQTVSDCHFEYGTSEAYGESVPCGSLPGSGEAPVLVSASVAGLSANTTYHFRIVATNVNGTGYGSDQTFQTLPNPPAAVTGAASPVGQTSATLNASVNPDGATVSDCHFEYGTTVGYGISVPCGSLPGSGESPAPVSAALTPGSLSENTTYHFRIVATNSGGTSYGSDEAFTTLPNSPSVMTGSASPITSSSASLNATVNPEGGAVSDCHFEYGPTAGYGSAVACSPAPGAGESPVAVSGAIAGLSASTTYHFRIVATNAGGTSYGLDKTFATSPNPTPAHWYKDKVKLKQGVALPIVSWGGAINVAQSGGLGEVNCKTVAAGSVENPVGGGSGVGKTQTSAFYECKEPVCEAEVAASPLGGLGYKGVGFAVAYNLPWKNEIVGATPNLEERIGAPGNGNSGRGSPRDSRPDGSRRAARAPRGGPPVRSGQSWAVKSSRTRKTKFRRNRGMRCILTSPTGFRPSFRSKGNCTRPSEDR